MPSQAKKKKKNKNNVHAETSRLRVVAGSQRGGTSSNYLKRKKRKKKKKLQLPPHLNSKRQKSFLQESSSMVKERICFRCVCCFCFCLLIFFPFQRSEQRGCRAVMGVGDGMGWDGGELTLSCCIPLESRVRTGRLPPHFIPSSRAVQGVTHTACTAIVFGKNVSSCQIALFLSCPSEALQYFCETQEGRF